MSHPSTSTGPVPSTRAPWIRASLLALVASQRMVNAQVELTRPPEEIELQIPRIVQPDPLANQPYTLKAGDLRLLVTTSLGLDWNDNVTISDGTPEDDFILRPSLQLRGSYPITANNMLRLNLGVGYDQYLEHSDLSTWRLDSGSVLAFEMAIKDFTFDLHNRVNYVRNGARTGDVADAPEQGALENTAGISARWLGGDVLVSSGFDHQNAWSISELYEYQNRATEIVPLRVAMALHPQVLAGIEANASFTSYTQPVLNDSSAYSVGAYAEWSPGTDFKIVPRAGFSIYDFRQTSVLVQAEDSDSWYADLTLSHRPREAFRYGLTAGHELRLGLQSDLVESWYVRPGITWYPNRRFTVDGNVFWETGTQGASQLAGVSDEEYDWYGFSVQVQAPITDNLRATLGYRLTNRSSGSLGRDYQQNVVSLNLTYTFQ